MVLRTILQLHVGAGSGKAGWLGMGLPVNSLFSVSATQACRGDCVHEVTPFFPALPGHLIALAAPTKALSPSRSRQDSLVSLHQHFISRVDSSCSVGVKGGDVLVPK